MPNWQAVRGSITAVLRPESPSTLGTVVCETTILAPAATNKPKSMVYIKERLALVLLSKSWVHSVERALSRQYLVDYSKRPLKLSGPHLVLTYNHRNRGTCLHFLTVQLPIQFLNDLLEFRTIIQFRGSTE